MDSPFIPLYWILCDLRHIWRVSTKSKYHILISPKYCREVAFRIGHLLELKVTTIMLYLFAIRCLGIVSSKKVKWAINVAWVGIIWKSEIELICLYLIGPNIKDVKINWAVLRIKQELLWNLFHYRSKLGMNQFLNLGVINKEIILLISLLLKLMGSFF